MQNTILAYLESQEAYPQSYKLVKQIEQGDNVLLNKTITDLENILTGQYSPQVHILSLALIKDIFLTGRDEAVKRLEQQILPLIVQAIEVPKQSGSEFGQTSFVNRPEYKKGDERKKRTIREMGVDYISLCLQSIKVWADWMQYTPQGHKSVFSQQYEDLLKRGVNFPKERMLYKNQDRDRFEKVYKKMEFFNSQSQFQESILNENNYGAIVEKELKQCESILEAIKVQLKPNESTTNWKRMKQYFDRADLFFHDESIRMGQDLKRLPDSDELLRRVLEMQSKYGRLIEDYEFYRAGKLSYDEFYRTYGNPTFQSKQPPAPSANPKRPSFQQQYQDSSAATPFEMKKRVLNASEEYDVGRSPTKTAFSKPSIVVNLNNEQIESIKREHQRNEQQLKQQYERLILQERQSAEMRVAELKKLIQTRGESLQEEWAKRIQSESQLYRQRYDQLLKDSIKKTQQIETQRLQIRRLQQDLQHVAGSNTGQQQMFRRTQDQLAKVKRTNIQLEDALKLARQKRNSQKDEKIPVQVRSQSSRTQNNQLQASMKKLEKKFDNLSQQNQILKQQLQIERKKSYKTNDVELQLLKDQNTRLKQTITHLQQNLTQQKLRIDLLQVQNLKLQESVKIKMSLTQSLQKENQWMTKTMQMPAPAPARRLEESLVRSRQSFGMAKKISVREYIDVTLEGDTYFQELSREFRVRFKRACLKKKELLFKQSGIEVGVISQRRASDHVSVAVFMTNYGIKDINDVRIKILNPSTNDITCEASHYEIFQQGQQQKFYVQAKILSYPMGPFILTISTEDTVLQLLLPITIVRLVSVTDRTEELKQPSRLNIRYDHKVVNTVEILKEYFPNVNFTQTAGGDIVAKIKAEHHHTYTTFSFDFKKQGDTVELAYEFEKGREEIMRYYIRILASIFEK